VCAHAGGRAGHGGSEGQAPPNVPESRAAGRPAGLAWAVLKGGRAISAPKGMSLAMFRSRTLVALATLSLALGIGSSPAQAQGGQGRKVANASKMARAAFESLSDDDVVEVGGKPMTKKQVMAQAKALRDARAPIATEADELENERASFSKKQKAALDTENAAVLVKMGEIRKAGGQQEVRKAGKEAQDSAPAPTTGMTMLVAPAPAPAAATPALSGMLGQLKPGSAVILFGSNFGTLEGEVRMYGTFPNGFIKLSVDSWGNGGIGVFVPADIKGVLDQQVTLKIVTKAGASSNYKTAPFTAARELRKMKMGEFAKRECRDAALSVDACTTTGQTGCSSSVCGDHSVPIFPGAAASTDRWSVTLKNTWTFDHHGYSGGTYFSPGPQEWVNPVVLLETYAMGNEKPKFRNLSTPTAPSFEVEWLAPSLWADTYKLDVYVVGPAGTSHI